MASSNTMIKEIQERKKTEHFKNLLKNAINVNFAVTDELEREVHRIYAPHQFSFGVDPAPKHAMAAIAQRFAYHQANNYVRNHRPFVEVGPNLSQLARITNGAQGLFHGCSMISARDLIRFREAAGSRYIKTLPNKTYREAVQLAASGVQTDYLCNQGFQNCHYQAPYAVAVHSLYDVAPEMLADGFEKHGTIEMLAFVHMTPAMLRTDRYVDYKNNITFAVMDVENRCQRMLDIRSRLPNFSDRRLERTIDELCNSSYTELKRKLNGYKVLMGFPGDEATQYEHDYATLLFYLSRSGFKTVHGFGISIERVNNYGSQYTLKLQRVELSCSLYHRISFSALDVIAVPDIVSMAMEDYPADYRPVIWTDRRKVETLYTYLMSREPKMLTLRVAFAYARANLRSVALGEHIIDYAWQISMGEFDRVVIGVYVMAKLQILRSEAVLETAKFKISGLYKRKSWLEALNRLFTCARAETSDMAGLPIITCRDRQNVFADLTISYFEDVQTGVHLDLNNIVTEVTFPEELGDNAEPEDDYVAMTERYVEEAPIVRGTLLDMGGDGDCFWRATGFTKDQFPTLPDTWVEYTDYIEACVKQSKPFSVLVRHCIDGTWNDIVHTSDANLSPTLALIVKTGDRGHYYRVGESDATITRANRMVYGLSGGGPPLTVEDAEIDLYREKALVAHAIWKHHPKTGKICHGSYAGFAQAVAQTHAHGVTDYCNVTAEARRRGLPHCATKTSGGTNVLNVICDSASEYYSIMTDYIRAHPHTRIVAPLVGAGLWNKQRLTPQNVLCSQAKALTALNQACVEAGCVYTIKFPAPLRMPDVGGGLSPTIKTTIQRPSDLKAFKTLVAGKVKTENQASIYVDELMMGARAAAEAGLKSLEVTLENAYRALDGPSPHLSCFADTCRVEGIFGVPGSGKTNSLIEGPLADAKRNGHSVLYLAPTSALVNAFKTNVVAPSRAETIHKGIWLLANERMKPDLIVLDECFTQPLPVLCYLSHYARKLCLMGDPNQIPFIDFTGMWGTATQLTECYKTIPHKWLNVTHRVPHDVATLPFMRRLYGAIESKSKKTAASLNYCDKFSDNMNGAHLVFTQEAKKMYSHYNAITVHEAQGSTFTSVILHYGGTQSEKELILRSPAHAVVALTRHTNNLYIIDPKQEFGVILAQLNECVALDIMLTPTQVALPDFTPLENNRHVRVTDCAVPTPAAPAADVDAQAVAEILNKIEPISNEVQEYQAVEKNDCEYKGGACGKLQVTDIKDPESKAVKKVFRFPVAQRVFKTDASRAQKVAQTMCSRYTKMTKNCKGKVLERELKRLSAIAHKIMEVRPPTLDEKNKLYAASIKAFQAKGHDVTDLKDIDCWTDDGINRVKFMMKHQQKVSMTDPLQKDKAGQGIAAWDKTLNFSMTVWCRWLEHQLYGSKKIMFTSGEDDVEILKKIDKILETADIREFMENDWKEFDSSQNNLEHELFLKTMRDLGCPEPLLQLFRAMMYSRYVVSSVGSVNVQNKKDSGRVDTLVGNTLFNVCVVLSFIVNWEELALICVKGDDSAFGGLKIILDQKRMAELNKSNGYQFKVKTGQTAEYTHLVLTPDGAAINVPRICAKVATRCYKTQADYEEYQTSVADLAKVMNDVEVQHHTAVVNAAHFRLPVPEIQKLIDFVMHFASGALKFSDLTEFVDLVKVPMMG